MSRFLKLTNKYINIHHITKVVTEKNMDFSIYTTNYSLDGFILFYLGHIIGNNNIIYVSSENDPVDHAIVKKWINSEDFRES